VAKEYRSTTKINFEELLYFVVQRSEVAEAEQNGQTLRKMCVKSFVLCAELDEQSATNQELSAESGGKYHRSWICQLA